MHKRVILKLSGEALAGSSDSGFDNLVVNDIISQIKKLIAMGIEVSIVVGGGNFWRGRSANPSMDRVKADQIGMMATVMNALYLSDACVQNGLESLVMTPFCVGSITEQFSKDKALDYLKEKKVIVFAGGIGHPFFSTDTITALRAAELEADTILFGKSIDGVYDSDPAINKDAKKLHKIPCREIIEKNLKVIDLAAANICYEQKIPVVIFGLSENNSIVDAAMGKEIGTIVSV